MTYTQHRIPEQQAQTATDKRLQGRNEECIRRTLFSKIYSLLEFALILVGFVVLIALIVAFWVGVFGVGYWLIAG
jgi:fatty acid desaturase